MINKSKIIIIKEELLSYWLVFVLFCLTIFTFLWSSIPSLYISVPLSSTICDTINTIVRDFSMSLFVGILVFILTVFIPSVRQKTHDLPNVTSLLYALEEEICKIMTYDVDQTLHPQTERTITEFLSHIIPDVSKENLNIEIITEEEGEMNVHYDCTFIFSMGLTINNIEAEIFELSFYSQYLTPCDRETLSEIRHCLFFNESRFKNSNKKTEFNEADLRTRLPIVKHNVRDYINVRSQVIDLAKKYDKYWTGKPSRLKRID